MNLPLAAHLEKIQYFLAIANSGSFAEAARKLKVAQPTLSQSIHILEDIVGTELFHRTSQGITLTDQGQILYQYGTEILLRTEQVSHALKSRSGPESGTIVLATKEPYATVLWPSYLKYLWGVLPELKIEFRISRTNDELLSFLMDEKVDAVMLPNPPNKGNLTSYELFKDRFGLFAAHSGVEQMPVYTFFGALTGTKKTVGQILSPLGVKHQVIDVDSFHVAKSFASNGLGIALMNQSFATDLLISQRLQTVQVRGLNPSVFGTLSVCLTFLSKNTKSFKLQKLRHALRKLHQQWG